MACCLQKPSTARNSGDSCNARRDGVAWARTRDSHLSCGSSDPRSLSRPSVSAMPSTPSVVEINVDQCMVAHALANVRECPEDPASDQCGRENSSTKTGDVVEVWAGCEPPHENAGYSKSDGDPGRGR